MTDEARRLESTGGVPALETLRQGTRDALDGMPTVGCLAAQAQATRDRYAGMINGACEGLQRQGAQVRDGARREPVGHLGADAAMIPHGLLAHD